MKQQLMAVFLLTLLTGQIRAESPCTSYKGDVTFVIDESEVAKRKSTTQAVLDMTNGLNTYDILRNQMLQFASNLKQEATNGVPVDVKWRIIAYTGFGNKLEATPTLDKYYTGQANTQITPALLQEILQLHNSGTVVIPDIDLTTSGTSTGGSWTNTGLAYANSNLSPLRTDGRNIIVLVSAQGSFNPPRQAASKAAADSLRAKGWRMFVIGVETLLDTTELLTNIAVNPNSFVNISSYNNLAETLRSRIKQSTDYLCDATTTTPAPTTTPRPPTSEHPCDCALKSGTYNIADNSTCHRFWICDKKDNAYFMHQFDCGSGTLFSTSTANCVYPQNYNCPAWDGYCKVGQPTSFYPHLCCAKSWECTNGTVYDRTCPSGQYFDNSPAVKRCRVPDATNFCLSDILCSRGNNVCNHAAVPNNPCSYIITDNPGGPLVRPCQPGSAFNKDTCVCSDPAPASCTRSLVPGVGEVDLSRDNTNCKALFHMDMTTSGRSLTVRSDDTNTVLPIYVDRQSTTAQNGTVGFNGRALTDATSYGKISDVLFVPYFAKRSFPNSWAFSLDFRFSAQADRTEYVLVTNDNCLSCVATYRLTATRAGTTSSQWTFKFWVQTASSQGYELVDREQAEISASIAITNNNQWSRVVVKVELQNPATLNTEGYKAVLSGTVSTANPANPSTNIQQAFSTATINNRVKYNECGLSLGQGREGPQGSKTTVAFKGDMDDFKFYECSNLSNLV